MAATHTPNTPTQPPWGGDGALPAAGNRWDGRLNNAGWNGNYWSSTANSATSANARNLNFNSGNVNPQDNWYRYIGRSVRPFRVSAPSSGR